ncbi:ChaC-like protein [compost metagenome]
MCYCIEASKVKSILAHLDFREKNGYARHYVHVYHSHTHEKFKSPVLIYVGTMQNPQFVDPNSETLDDVAHVIATAHGPSGKNSEYLFNLAHALAEMNVVDEHVEKLTLMVKHKMSNKAHQ